MKRARSGNGGALVLSHVQGRFVQQGGGAKARLPAAPCEFTFGEAMQFGIKGSKQCFRGRFVPPFRRDKK